MGVPVIGCSCAVCSSPDPRDKRTRASVYVKTPEACWVIDTGTDFRAQCLREGVTTLDAVVLTHAHTDHVMGFDDLRPFCFGGRTLPVYASKPTMEAMRRIYDWAFDGMHRYPGYLMLEPLEVEGRFDIGKTAITPLPVEHGKAPVNGYLMERGDAKIVAYLSDVKRVPAPVIDALQGVDTLIIDALRKMPHPTHLCFEESVAIARAVGARKTWFTHLCHDAGHAETEAGLPPDIRVAYDGLKLSW